MKYTHIKATYYLLATTYYQSPPQLHQFSQKQPRNIHAKPERMPSQWANAQKGNIRPQFSRPFDSSSSEPCCCFPFLGNIFRSQRIKPTLPETNSSPLAMVGRWKFLLGRPVFRGFLLLVSGRVNSSPDTRFTSIFKWLLGVVNQTINSSRCLSIPLVGGFAPVRSL